jgi:hypothetical protein
VVFYELHNGTETIADIAIGKTDKFRSLAALPPLLQHLVGYAQDVGRAWSVKHAVGREWGHGNLGSWRNLHVGTNRTPWKPGYMHCACRLGREVGFRGRLIDMKNGMPPIKPGTRT